MRINRKHIRKIVIAIVIFLALNQFCHYQTGGYRQHKIVSNLSFDPAWALEGDAAERNASNEKIALQLLDQPFYFLGSGRTAFAFASQDDRYVIKFVRHNHLRPTLWATLLPPYKKQKAAELDLKRRRNFTGHTLGFSYLPEETQLVYLHLNKTSHLNKTVTIFDKIGVRHDINIDDYEFVLQRKATVICTQLSRFIQDEHPEMAKECLDNLLYMIVRSQQKGIIDRDPNLHLNYGFIDTTPVLIDTGGLLTYEEHYQIKPQILLTSSEEIFEKTRKFRDWLSQNHFALANYFENQIASL